jgi:cytochrome P450
MTDQEQGYFPFGGGKHSCPGRSYAFVQTLAIVMALIGRFDIRGEDGGLVKVP